ncbi:MAG: hypothetical protein ACREA0_33815, partial [bacterium]
VLALGGADGRGDDGGEDACVPVGLAGASALVVGVSSSCPVGASEPVQPARLVIARRTVRRRARFILTGGSPVFEGYRLCVDFV